MPEELDPQNAPAAPEEPAPPPPPDWTNWQTAGWEPDAANPYEVRQAYDREQAFRDRDRRGRAIEDILRGHELPEGMTWQDAQEAIAAHARTRSDPWQALQNQQQAPGAPDPSQVPGYYEEPELDMETMRSLMRHEAEQAVAAYKQQTEQQDSQRRVEEEFTRELERLRAQHNLDDGDMQIIAAQAVANAAGMMRGQPLTEVVKTTWDNLSAWRRSAMQNAIEDQVNAPQTTTPRGPAAGDKVPQSLEEAEAIVRALDGQA